MSSSFSVVQHTMAASSSMETVIDASSLEAEAEAMDEERAPGKRQRGGAGAVAVPEFEAVKPHEAAGGKPEFRRVQARARARCSPCPVRPHALSTPKLRDVRRRCRPTATRR